MAYISTILYVVCPWYPFTPGQPSLAMVYLGWSVLSRMHNLLHWSYRGPTLPSPRMRADEHGRSHTALGCVSFTRQISGAWVPDDNRAAPLSPSSSAVFWSLPVCDPVYYTNYSRSHPIVCLHSSGGSCPLSWWWAKAFRIMSVDRTSASSRIAAK